MGARLRAVLSPVPPEHQAGFARSIAYTNWLHALWVAAAAATVNTVCSLLPEIQYYRSGLWPSDPIHLTLTGLHVLMVLLSVAAVALLRLQTPATRGEAGPAHERLALSYGIVMLAVVTAFSVVEQQLTGSISAYLLGVSGFATLFYTSPRFNLGASVVSMLGLIAGSLWLQPGSPVVWHHLFVGLDAVVLFWIGSRIGYYLKAVNYLQLVTIKRQAEALAIANAELAHANQFKTDLLALAVHDLREPLGGISLSAQTLLEELPANSPLRPLVDGIDSSSRHLAEFVSSFLGDVHSDTDQLSLERTSTVLSDLVREVVVELRPAAAAKAIELHFAERSASHPVPLANVDRACFRQIVENLIRNALKYSLPHKQVWLELAYLPGEGHRFSVRDEGPGLTPQDFARLFQKHQRLSARPTGGESSTGLGLYIVKQLVVLHGGRVWAESAGAGRGATFVVVIP